MIVYLLEQGFQLDQGQSDVELSWTYIESFIKWFSLGWKNILWVSLKWNIDVFSYLRDQGKAVHIRPIKVYRCIAEGRTSVNDAIFNWPRPSLERRHLQDNCWKLTLIYLSVCHWKKFSCSEAAADHDSWQMWHYLHEEDCPWVESACEIASSFHS